MLAVLFVLLGTVLVFAEPTGKAKKGKFIYKKVYKTCHKRGEVESKTPVVSPGDKTRAQWTRVFDKKKFKIFTNTNNTYIYHILVAKIFI